MSLQPLLEKTTAIAYSLLLYLTYMFWLVAVIAIWPPLLVMNIAAFCGLLIYNMLVNKPESVANGQANLDYTVSFISVGINKIRHTLQPDLKIEKTVTHELRIPRFIFQIIWIVLFWVAVTFPFWS